MDSPYCSCELTRVRPRQLRRRYGTILPYGYRKATADDKPRFRYRQYNRLFIDEATGGWYRTSSLAVF